MKKAFPSWSKASGRLPAHYVGGATPDEIDQAITDLAQLNWMYFMLDYVAFDSSITGLTLTLVRDWLESVGFPRSGPAARLWEAWCFPQGKARCGLRFDTAERDARRAGVDQDYKATSFLCLTCGLRQPLRAQCTQCNARRHAPGGPNASGRDDTSLINGYLNAMVMSASVACIILGTDDAPLPFCQLTGPDWDRVSYESRLLVMGDDTLGAIQPRYESRLKWLPDVIAQFGFASKMQTSSSLHKCTFLGCKPVQVHKPDGSLWWTLGRVLGRSLYKQYFCKTPNLVPDRLAWARGVALGVLASYPYMPIMSDIAAQVARLTNGVGERPAEHRTGSFNLLDQARARSKQGYTACPETYAQVFDVYGIGWADYSRFLERLRRVERLPCTVVDFALQNAMFCGAEEL